MDGSLLGKPRPVRSLSFHADYRCRNTGICCSSGWEIAVEEPVEVSLRPRLQTNHETPNGPDGFVPMMDPPKGCKSAFRQTHAGVCWFRDPERRDCAIHRDFGEDALASACRQFPRVVVLEPSQVSVSLSHYCPTAAALLFRETTDFSLRDNPEAFPPGWPFEGLDAREAYSPLLRPGVLLGFDGLRRLEDEAIALFAEPGFATGIGRVEAALSRLREWGPGSGPVPDFITLSLSGNVDGCPSLHLRPGIRARFSGDRFRAARPFGSSRTLLPAPLRCLRRSTWRCDAIWPLALSADGCSSRRVR
jgi:hypothetical protein